MIELLKKEDGFWLSVEGTTKKGLIKIRTEAGFCWQAMEEHCAELAEAEAKEGEDG